VPRARLRERRARGGGAGGGGGSVSQRADRRRTGRASSRRPRPPDRRKAGQKSHEVARSLARAILLFGILRERTADLPLEYGFRTPRSVSLHLATLRSRCSFLIIIIVISLIDFPRAFEIVRHSRARRCILARNQPTRANLTPNTSERSPRSDSPFRIRRDSSSRHARARARVRERERNTRTRLSARR